MREINRRYRDIGKRLIEKRDELKDIREFGITVAYLSSDHPKKKAGRMILGDCTKVSESYAWAVKRDFMITIYEPNITMLNRKQLEILIFHELLHIGVDCSGDEPRYYARPHDVEEFDVIIKEFGMNWEVGDE